MGDLAFKLESADPIQERRFLKKIEHQLVLDDSQAAQAHLAAGRPIYYREAGYSDGIVRRWPNGHKQLVNVDLTGKITVLSNLL